MSPQLTALTQLITSPAVHSPHDTGVRQVAQLNARLSYALTCMTLVWGIFTATGWVAKLTGRQAVRSTHMVLATFALAFGGIHTASFLFLTDSDETFGWINVLVPLVGGGQLRWALGIVGVEVMAAIMISTGLVRFFVYRRWLRLHQTAYPAVALIIVHSWLGAIANGHLEILWLAGLTVLIPTAVLTVLRVIPSRTLVGAGLLNGG
ncbi:ferric reductase-like transmembrane domain-containing protein [Kutzneria buriramensis]|uniref:Sulfoxide reductase heme-binding subunit YedZ n=1 Tax=Kutzneria buriramensis TaxID=1045776 RepID=A0A3E0GYS4_9PSEU|nr:ferric reductase-like transmembrane domain-containing protein [Kutzneria buriramensis]REH34905.1 sulfoxide reductase heme-binding subunit YedZ [Kutzneria buriramensis]